VIALMPGATPAEVLTMRFGRSTAQRAEVQTTQPVEPAAAAVAVADPGDDTVFLARAPIFDRDRRVVAYEVLHQRTGADSPDRVGAEASDTDELVEHSLLQWGFDRLLEGKRGHLRVDPTFLERGLHRTLPASQVVLEVDDTIDVDGAAFAHALRAKQSGFKLAVRHAPDRFERVSADLLTLADLVRVDVGRIGTRPIDQVVESVRRTAPGAVLLAGEVDDRDVFDRCAAIGFDLLEGDFFTKPELLARSAKRVSTLSAMALLAEVQQREVSIDRLEQLVVGDPTLAFRLLTLVNSSVFGLNQRVESIHHAIVLLGIERVRQMATLITMAASSKPDLEIITVATTRAYMARSLIDRSDLESGAYTAGLLSVLDVVFRMPMAELVDELPLSATVAEALRDGTGSLGRLLGAIRAYERADLQGLERLRPGELARFLGVYRDAAAFAQDLRMQLMAA
jgi:c-di-GMP phosphodiesterase